MSTGFGYNKGKDGKYNTLNLTSYKGRSIDSSKHPGSTVRHGLQSLGKVASSRRVPPPANLPSLKSENLGNDPNVNLVPKDGSGWASKTETQNQQNMQQQASQAPQESQPRQASATYSQPSMYQTSNQSTASSRSQSSTSTTPQSVPSQQTWGTFRHTQAGNRVSAAAGGVRGRGTTPFSEEFPTLGDTQKEQQNNEKSNEQQYGPGPSLRPQNVASWREGGGRNLSSSKESYSAEESKTVNSSIQPSIPLNQTANAMDMHSAKDGQGPSVPQRPLGHMGMGQNFPQGYPPHYRPNIMPPHQFVNMYSGMGPPAPGMRYPSSMHPSMRYPPYMNDARFRSMMGQGLPSQPQEAVNVPAIISKSELKDFDKMEKTDDGDWAGMHGEVDYGEKLVFSDEEDNNNGGGKKSSQSVTTQANTRSSDQMDKRSKGAVNLPHQAWGPPGPPPQSFANMEHAAMVQWSHPYNYSMYRGPMPGQPSLDSRGKPQAMYDKRMPPQGQPYHGGQVPPPQLYGCPPVSMGPRFAGPMTDPSSMERSSPGADEDHWRKNEKEEAMERARKRREEEELRMEMQRRSDVGGYPYSGPKHDARYPVRLNSADEERKGWVQDFPSGQDERRPYSGKPRTESESSEERRSIRDRMPGDGYGGFRPPPHPSAGSSITGGRNLPPRLANQRHKQDNFQRIPSPGYQSQMGFDHHWMGGPPSQHNKQSEQRFIRPSIMKRDRFESEGSENQDSRPSRKVSDSSSYSAVTPGGETPSDERRTFSGRDLLHKDDRKPDEKRHLENVSPTVGSDKEARLWNSGPKRSSIKRQTSRDSPLSVSSAGDSHHSTQKTLLSRNDSGSMPITKWGSSQSDKSIEKEEPKAATVRPRRSDKVKLRDFRVEGDDDEEANLKAKKPDDTGKDSKFIKEESSKEHHSWKSDKVSRPVATVLPSTATTTTTVSRSSGISSVTTRITRDVADTRVHDNVGYEANAEADQRDDVEEDMRAKSVWDEDFPDEVASNHESDARAQSAKAFPSSKFPRERDNNQRNRDRNQDPRGNRRNYDRSDRSDRRYSNKDNRYSEKPPPKDRQGDRRGPPRDDNRGGQRGPRSDGGRYRGSHDSKPRRPDDRSDNRNRKENREKRDTKISLEETSERTGNFQATQQARKTDANKHQTTQDKILTSSMRITAASAPPVNIWEERKKQLEKIEKERNTFIPREEDKKRTLKETAPPPKFDAPSKPFCDDEEVQNRKSADVTLPVKPRGSDSRQKQNDFSDKRQMDGKSYRNSNNRRPSGSRPQNRGDRKTSRDFIPDAERRGPTRGRGRSRGSSFRGRGRSQNSLAERSTAGRGSAPPRGRGSQRSYRSSSQYEKWSGSASLRGRYSDRYNDADDSESPTDETADSDDYDHRPISHRRRRVGEASDADDYSSDGSFSDDDAEYDLPVKKNTVPHYQDSRSKQPPSINEGRYSSKPSQTAPRASSSATFTARGEPSRRGRGRGAFSSAPRGRGRGASRGTGSAPPLGRGSRTTEDYNEPPRSKNGEGGPQGGATSKRFGISQVTDRRRKRNKVVRAPRFNTGTKTQHRDDNSKAVNGIPITHQDGASQSGDGAVTHSSDVGNEEWETASDNSADLRKVTLKAPFEEIKRGEPKRSFSNQRPPSSGRGRGRGASQTMQDKPNIGKVDNQVYTLHTVKYNNPTAIEGALREASLNPEEKSKKYDDGPKAKHEELFRMYEMNHYAGVVNVDDLPEVSSQRKLQSELAIEDDLANSLLESSALVPQAKDDDGFTPVLSKRALKKKQEEIRKKDEERTNEALMKIKLEQQQRNRQKFFNKTSEILSGTSGSIKQSFPSTITDTASAADIWSNIGTWAPTKTTKKEADVVADVSISQHDSGVESSVTSSQRSSPGTEAKLSFSHFGSVLTSTSVITSVCDHEVPTTSTLLQTSADIVSLMAKQQGSGTLPKSDVVASLSEVSSATESPSRSVANPIRPIGNERGKMPKRSNSVDNLTSLFSSMNDQNVISFIADSADDTVPNVLSSDERQSNAFLPFVDSASPSVAEIRRDLTPRPGFPGFQQSDYSDDRPSSEASLSSLTKSSYLPMSSFSNSTSVATSLSGELPLSIGTKSPSNIERNFRRTIPGVAKQPLQQGFLDPLPDIAGASHSISNLVKAGVKSDSDPSEDMTLNPQAPNNQNVNHTAQSLEGSIPVPISLPPKHISGASHGPDGDKAGVRQTRDVNSNTNGAGDMGLLAPTSPSVEFNLKMESARKAWEKVPESSSTSSQQQNLSSGDTYTFHQSTANMSEHAPAETSSMSSVTLSVTKSSEWKPRQPAVASTPSSECDESWRNVPAQSSSNLVQVSQAQEIVSKPAITSPTETTDNLHGSFPVETPVSAAMPDSLHQQQQHSVAPTYTNSSVMFLDQTPSYTPQQLTVQPNVYQTISSTSLATNLHNMQHAYTNLPPQSFYSTQTPGGYSNLTAPHATYNAQHRDYNQALLLGTSVKTSTPTTVALKTNHQAIQPTIRGGSMHNYATTSAIQGLNQSNIASAQLALPRPHGGPSPAHPIAYIPLVDQSRVVAATQASPGQVISQPINTAQRPQSSSFYSPLNQTGSSYFPQPAASQVHRQQPSYPQTLTTPPISYQQAQNHISMDHASIWTMGNIQPSAGYAPIAPPSQRVRSDSDFSSGYQYYQPKAAYPAAASKLNPVSSQQPGFGAVKLSVPISSSAYSGMKNPQIYPLPKVSTPVNQDLMSSATNQLAKFSMSSAPSPSAKPFVGLPSGGDINKPSSNAQQYKPSSVHGILSRPFSSTEAMFQQSSSTVSGPSYFQQKPQDLPPRLPSQSVQPFNTPQAVWGQPKSLAPQTGQGLLGSQPPVSLMGAIPRPPMIPTSMVGQRYATPQNYQQSGVMTHQIPAAPRPSAPFQPKASTIATRPPSVSSESKRSANKPGKSVQSSALSHSKTPPVPTLVRGSGNNLAGKKPTFMPEEIVKSNQASERASLLQSLSALMDNKEKAEGSESTAWSAQVANSAPLPKRKPGMRHPGIDRRKSNNKDGKVGSNGATKTVKRLQPRSNKKEEGDSRMEEAAESVIRPVKKMTLADTKPKKGEVAKIQLN